MGRPRQALLGVEREQRDDFRVRALAARLDAAPLFEHPGPDVEQIAGASLQKLRRLAEFDVGSAPSINPATIEVASNAPFSEWGQTFTDRRLAAAVVDRLTFRAHILWAGSESCRLRVRRAK